MFQPGFRYEFHSTNFRLFTNYGFINHVHFLSYIRKHFEEKFEGEHKRKMSVRSKVHKNIFTEN
jgi:hypothetical protein